MIDSVRIGPHQIGPAHPAFIVAEIGINHNGDLRIAKKLIDVASAAGCGAVKFQKRTPELCVPMQQRELVRETPWGSMTYFDYRRRMEFTAGQYGAINEYAASRKISWFASPWDEAAVDFLEPFEPIAYKVASASVTDRALLARLKRAGRPVILSTGMSTLEEIDAAVECLSGIDMLIAHSTSTYPCSPEELNLRMIPTLSERYGVPVGYSGHEVGLQTTLAAVTLGACFVERHITLDRAMWGSDQAASVEAGGFFRLVRDIRTIEAALGDGIKQVYPSEIPSQRKLRRSMTTS